MESEITDFKTIKYPVTAFKTDEGYFSVGIVLKKEHLEKAIQLEKDYGHITPFVLAKGAPERIMEIHGKKVVRLQVVDALPITREKINVLAKRVGNGF